MPPVSQQMPPESGTSPSAPGAYARYVENGSPDQARGPAGMGQPTGIGPEIDQSRQCLEAAPNAMIVVDEDGAIVLINSKVQSLFGYTSEELIGERIDLLVPDSVRRRHAKLRDSF